MDASCPTIVQASTLPRHNSLKTFLYRTSAPGFVTSIGKSKKLPLLEITGVHSSVPTRALKAHQLTDG